MEHLRILTRPLSIIHPSCITIPPLLSNYLICALIRYPCSPRLCLPGSRLRDNALDPMVHARLLPLRARRRNQPSIIYHGDHGALLCAAHLSLYHIFPRVAGFARSLLARGITATGSIARFAGGVRDSRVHFARLFISFVHSFCGDAWSVAVDCSPVGLRLVARGSGLWALGLWVPGVIVSGWCSVSGGYHLLGGLSNHDVLSGM